MTVAIILDINKAFVFSSFIKFILSCYKEDYIYINENKQDKPPKENKSVVPLCGIFQFFLDKRCI